MIKRNSDVLTYLILVITVLLCSTRNESVSGGGSNTGNANILSGIIRESDGMTPARCSAYLYRSDALPVRAGENDTNIVSMTSTDPDGRFKFSGIADGTYNIYCIDSSQLLSTLVPDLSVAGNDSIFIGENVLRPVGSIEGQIINAPRGEAVVAFIYGSPIIKEIRDTTGFFLLSNLPVGTALSINFMTEERVGGKRCRAQYQYATLPDTTPFITVRLECDPGGP